jgi:proteasome lid subunit RPN8/RPN11
VQDLFNLVDPNGEELCGVIMRDGTIKVLENVHPEPRDNFAMDATTLGDPEVVATWHTHPRSSPNLTVADFRAFRQFPRLRHYIVGLSEIWCYRMQGDILVLDDNYFSSRLPARSAP